MERRKAAADRTRARVLKAARSLLAGKGAERFSLDAVARKAGVARMTVYYQFGSRMGLFAALFDQLAEQGELPERLTQALRGGDPDAVLKDVVDAFAYFWETGREWVRRVRAQAVLDAELGRALEARNDLRRSLVHELVERVERRDGAFRAAERTEIEATLYLLTGFETFDTLAGPGRSIEDAAPAVLRLARAALESAAGRRRKKV